MNEDKKNNKPQGVISCDPQKKLLPKEWFETIFIGKKIRWGTNSFSDIAAIELIEKYVEYQKQ